MNGTKKPKKPEALQDTLARVRGEKAYFDTKKERGTYSRTNRALLEKKTRKGAA